MCSCCSQINTLTRFMVQSICYDRMIIQGYISGWSHAEGMTGYLNANYYSVKGADR